MSSKNTIKNFDLPLLTPKGEPIKGPDGADLLMRDEIMTALMAPGSWDENAWMRKVNASALAMTKIYKGGEIELTPNEVEIIKERVCKILYPLSVHRIVTYLEE